MSDTRKKYESMKVVDLRQELDKLGLDKNGVKMVLVERLIAHFEGEAAKSNANGEANGKSFVANVEVLESTDDPGMEAEDDDEQHPGDDENAHDDYEEGDHEEYEEEVDGHGMEGVSHEDAEDGDEPNSVTRSGENNSADHEEEDNEGDALKITVEENEKLEMEEDGKSSMSGAGDAESRSPTKAKKGEEGNDGGTDEATADNEESSNKATSADQDNKRSEGENNDKASMVRRERDTERHIILVTGLSSDTSANDLKTLFRKHGKIGRIKIMTNTRVPGSQRFAHISVTSLDDLNALVDTLNGAELKGKNIRVSKAPEDGSISRSYEIAVAAAAETDPQDGSGHTAAQDSKGSKGGDASKEGKKSDEADVKSDSDEIHIVKDTRKEATRAAGGKVEETGEKEGGASSSPEKKKEGESNGKQKSPDKSSATRPSDRGLHTSARKESHDRGRRPELVRHPRQHLRRDKEPDWRRHGGPPRAEVTRVHRDRVPLHRPHPGGGYHHQGGAPGRRRSPHTLTFEQIREIRDEQRKRELERRKREEERERVAEMERQKRLEYQNYMEFKHLEREKEKLRHERERIEREKLELFKMERERQKAEREKIEREKEELRRVKMNIEHSSHRSTALKRSFEEDKDHRRESAERKKPFTLEAERNRARPDVKTEAVRKIERERYERERLHGAHAAEPRTRSPIGVRESRRDVWARDERAGRPDRNRSDERSTHVRRDAEGDRRAREAPSRAATGSSELVPRYSAEGGHSSSRAASSAKRPSERYEETRSQGRDEQWMQRSSYIAPGSSLSLQMSSSTQLAGRESWPMQDRKLEAWDTSRLPPRTEQWISGAGTALGASGGRSSLPAIPPPPMYSAASLGLAPTSGLGLGSYSSDRYDSYKAGFQHLRRF